MKMHVYSETIYEMNGTGEYTESQGIICQGCLDEHIHSTHATKVRSYDDYALSVISVEQLGNWRYMRVMHIDERSQYLDACETLQDAACDYCGYRNPTPEELETQRIWDAQLAEHRAIMARYQQMMATG